MNNILLNIEVQEFINSNLNSDIASILLKGTVFKDVETKAIIEQIEAKKKCEKKLPTWFKTPRIYYPNKLNIEQTSSEITAQFKASLINGNSIIDLTGGFGVDSYYFSRRFAKVTYCEIDSTLTEIVMYNYKLLQVTSIDVYLGDGLQYLQETKEQVDWIYIDPSRRHDTKGKVFFLKDCHPNVPQHIDLLFNHSKNIMLKTSPLLDISVGISELKYVMEIYIVAVENEVKELLWILKHKFVGEIVIRTTNITKQGVESFSIKLNEEAEIEAKYSEPLHYLYEPNASILKSGGFKSVSAQLNVFKLGTNSHLYTNEHLIDFPGRRFKIVKALPYSKAILKKELPKKANITVRNFPETVAQIRKKFKIKDGGDLYLFFTTDLNNEKIVLICYKVEI